MISAEAPVLFAKAAEMFIHELTMRAWIHTEVDYINYLLLIINLLIALFPIGPVLTRTLHK